MDEIRKEIDAVDREMVELFEKRLDLVYRVAEYKFKNHGEIFDPEREKAIIKKNTQYLRNENYTEAYVAFLHAVMDQSKEIQRKYIEDQENH